MKFFDANLSQEVRSQFKHASFILASPILLVVGLVGVICLCIFSALLACVWEDADRFVNGRKP